MIAGLGTNYVECWITIYPSLRRWIGNAIRSIEINLHAMLEHFPEHVKDGPSGIFSPNQRWRVCVVESATQVEVRHNLPGWAREYWIWTQLDKKRSIQLVENLPTLLVINSHLVHLILPELIGSAT